MFYVYIFQNKRNHKIYVGKTDNLSKRLAKHKNCAKNPITYFHKSLAKNGIESFSFFTIEEWGKEEDCLEAEKFWIEFFQSNRQECGYNLTEGGDGSSGYKHTPETIRKISGKGNAFYGKKHTKETKKQIGRSVSKALASQHDERSAKVSGENNPKAKLTSEDVNNIRTALAAGETQTNIAKRYSVKQALISKIKLGTLWKKTNSSPSN
jgi:group I intron endonuclease